MKRGTIEHPKMLLLEAALRISKIEAIGLMEALWHWTARYAPRGDIGKYTDEQIAEGVYWPRKDCARLMQALVEKGWIDRHDEFRLVVHGWSEHAEDMVRKYLKRSGQTFADGRPPYTRVSSRRDDGVIPVSSHRDDTGMNESGHSHTVGMPHARDPSPSPSPSSSPVPVSGDGHGAEAGTPDEAHRELVKVAVLRSITWEEDLLARRAAGVGLTDPRLLNWAKKAADDAVLMRELDAPPAWWRRQIEKNLRPGGGPKSGAVVEERKPRRWKPEEMA